MSMWDMGTRWAELADAFAAGVREFQRAVADERERKEESAPTPEEEREQRERQQDRKDRAVMVARKGVNTGRNGVVLWRGAKWVGRKFAGRVARRLTWNGVVMAGKGGGLAAGVALEPWVAVIAALGMVIVWLTVALVKAKRQQPSYALWRGVRPVWA